MAKKKAKKKVEMSEIRQKPGTSRNMGPVKMDAAYIRKMQKLVADIGSHKRRGAIYIISPAGEPDKQGKVKATGVMFMHKMANATVLGTMLRHLEVDPLTVLALLADQHGHE